MDTYEQYLMALQKPNRKYVLSIEQLYKVSGGFESYNEITGDISNSNGSLSISLNNGIRRKLSFLINNPNFKYMIDSNRELWLDSFFRLKIGLEISENNVYWTNQGIYVLDDSSMSSASSSEHTISINALDRMSLLDGTLAGYLTSDYSIVLNNRLKDTIASILIDAGDNLPLVFDSIYNDYLNPYTLTADLGSTYVTLFNKLAEFRTSNFYYDVNSCFNFRSGLEDISDVNKPILYSFTDNDINLISSEVKNNIEKVKNYIKVVGDVTDAGVIYAGYAYDNDPSSPTSISRVGIRPAEPLTVDNIESDQFCIDRAVHELKLQNQMSMMVTITCFPILHLDTDCVIEFTNKHYGFDHQKLLIQNIDWNLSDGGTMTLTCSNIFDVDYNTSITGVVA